MSCFILYFKFRYLLLQSLSLPVQLFAGSTAFLCSSCVSLYHIGNTVNAFSYIGYGLCLFLCSLGNFIDQIINLTGSLYDLLQGSCSILCKLCAFFYSSYGFFNKGCSILCCICGFLGKVSYLVRYYRKALTVSSCSCRLNRCIQG